jgi:cytochrome c-type biogenesis protein CcmF
MAPALFLMAVGPLARWKQAALPELAHRLRWALGVAVAAALLAAWRAGLLGTLSVAGLAMACWIFAGTAADLLQRLRPGGGTGWRMSAVPRAAAGMMLAHVGVGVFIVGVTLVRGGEVVHDLKLAAGDTATVGGYGVVFRGTQAVTGPNYDAVQARVEITRDGRPVATLRPEKRVYGFGGTPMTEAAIDPGFTRDLYVALGEPVDGGRAWLLRVQVKPFVQWIWGGCALMALGGALAASDRRYRVSQRRAAPAAAQGLQA